MPDEVSNYVTPKDLEELMAEKHALITERTALSATTEQEKRIASNFITAIIHLIDERIATAKVVELSEQPKGKLRFGATLMLKIHTTPKPWKSQTYQLIGVDEADITKHKISFISPIAKILIGKKVGE
ncbi:MAG: GreA/GreB family elongation factor [Algoriphagus sp.]|uniref:GreA/GreB family elongation factor n=1 Tax=Algoriphagus sp. TaxID=1872435 RepID=UPI00262E944E|nr:GreA/GreB family elongation factor [Algoriphagus sp.]MDG1278814.1 GreA/GreB family elongation factor [Algoriphagus sp.]